MARRLKFECLEPRRLLAAEVLYDGALQSLPAAQSWLYLTQPLAGSSATQSLEAASVLLDTTAAQDDKAGYFGHFHPRLPELQRSTGFRLTWSAQLLEESHASMHRAGFSVIVLDEQRRGIELGYWTDRVWAQSDSPLFQQAESAEVDTTAVLAHYDLYVHGEAYFLYREGQRLLSGPLRDYSSFGAPYNQPGFLFLGDDTSSADARVRLSRVTVETGTQPQLCLEWDQSKLDLAAPSAVDFGPLLRGSENARQVLALLNTGEAPLVIASLEVTSPAFAVDGPWPEQVDPGEEIQLPLIFQATSETGRHAGTLSLSSSDSAFAQVDIPLLAYVSAGPLGQNPRDPYDVNDNGHVTPLDVLILVNYLNTHLGDHELPATSPPPFLDPSGDGLITVSDVLLVLYHGLES